MKSEGNLVQALNRDCRWLEAQIKRLHKATALDGERMRRVAGEILEQAEKRRKRTLARRVEE
jgi:hypothetical protein